MHNTTQRKTMANTKKTLIFIILVCLLQHAKAQPTPRNTDPYAYAKFSPSMAVIIVILIAALFFIAFFSIYIRHCSTRTTTSSSASVRTRAAAAANARRGLDPQVIETFPTLVYSMVKNLKIGKGSLECAVCLCEFEDHETLRLIPKCDHVFHPDCIGQWLTSHKTCPVCRADLSVVDSSAQLGESVPELHEQQVDLEEQQRQEEEEEPQQQRVTVEELVVGQPPVRRTKFPRSHSTGHSLVQPGENTDRFTLRLPVEVRKQIVNRRLNRATSMVLLPREGSSRRGYRSGSSRGKYYRRIEELEQDGKSDRWGFGRVGPFLSKMSSSVRSMSRSLSVRSKSVKSNRGECSSCKIKEPEMNIGDRAQLPV